MVQGHTHQGKLMEMACLINNKIQFESPMRYVFHMTPEKGNLIFKNSLIRSSLFCSSSTTSCLVGFYVLNPESENSLWQSRNSRK